MSSVINNLAKACAFVIFADGKIEIPELDTAKALFEKYGLDWFEGETLIKKYIDSFIDKSEDEKEEESDFELGEIHFDDVDSFEVLKDLALICATDGEISIGEIDVIHSLAEAFELDGRFASLALFNAVKSKSNIKISVE